MPTVRARPARPGKREGGAWMTIMIATSMTMFSTRATLATIPEKR